MKNYLGMTSLILISIMGVFLKGFSQPSLAARLSSSCVAEGFDLITLVTESYSVFDSPVNFDNVLITRKIKYTCKVCDWPSQCNMRESQGCSWISFYEGDTTSESLCCSGTKSEINN